MKDYYGESMSKVREILIVHGQDQLELLEPLRLQGLIAPSLSLPGYKKIEPHICLRPATKRSGFAAESL